MTTISHDLRAACPPEALWRVLSDLTAVERYNPAVRAARHAGGTPGSAGAVRECDLHPKGRLTERVTLWDEGRALGLEVVASDWPITRMDWVTRIEPTAGGSRVTQELTYQTKFGPVGRILDMLVMRRAIARNVGAALAGMIAMAEAGT